MKMSQIIIKDLRGVGDVELNLDDSKRVFVFFGSNGVGKTKTLESLFYVCLAQTEVFYPKANFDINYEIATSIKKDHLYLFFEPTNLYEILSQIKDYSYEAIAYVGANYRIFTDKTNIKQSFSTAPGFIQQTFFYNIENALANDSLDDFPIDENIHQWFIERAKSVNPYQIEKDNKKNDIDTVLNALNILDNRIEKNLKIDGDGNVFLTVEGQERELSELSSGFISVVKIIQSIISAYSAFTNATDLLNVKGVVLIDEIESHLHIEWQTKIVPTLKNLFPNTTFYIATHSPLVLSQLAEGEAYLLKRDDDNVVRSEIIDSPNKRLLIDVLKDAFDVDLNQLKRKNMTDSDQTLAKQKLLDLLGDD